MQARVALYTQLHKWRANECTKQARDPGNGVPEEPPVYYIATNHALACIVSAEEHGMPLASKDELMGVWGWGGEGTKARRYFTSFDCILVSPSPDTRYICH